MLKFFRPINPKAIFPNEEYYVVNMLTLRVVQSEATEKRAVASCKILQDHEEKNGRKADYKHFRKDAVTIINNWEE